jgi:4-hydroxybenzoate polyprenyltransferase/phosphoserine phosphatase
MDGAVLAAREIETTTDRVPLVVDLDGTLVRTDTLIECVVATVRQPLKLLRALAALRFGKARLKQELAAATDLDPALLPYNEELLNFLRQEQRSGRPLILATAADRRIGLDVARHLDLFDCVLASDGHRNLKGTAKLAAIRETLGDQPFAYVGDDRADLAIWREAESGITVNASHAVARAAAQATHIEAEFTARATWIKALARAVRPHQWVKNLLVFVPMATAMARQGGDAHELLDAVMMFAAFCCTASGIYLVNDLCDLAADRQHEKKRSRPFASGALSLPTGLAVAPLLIASGVGLSLAAGAFTVLAAYAAISIAYSLYFKSRPLVDVFMLAGLYTIRMIGGGVATGHYVSLWLLAFSSFLFLSLAIVKRVAELQTMSAASEKSRVAGRGYRAGDIRILEQMGVAASFVTSLVLALYVQSELIGGAERSPTLSWAIVPLILFWQCRIWLATSRGRMHHDPIVFAARDWVSWLVVACSFGALLLGNKISIAAL